MIYDIDPDAPLKCLPKRFQLNFPAAGGLILHDK